MTSSEAALAPVQGERGVRRTLFAPAAVGSQNMFKSQNKGGNVSSRRRSQGSVRMCTGSDVRPKV